MKEEKKNNEKGNIGKLALEPFAVVHAENEYLLYRNNLVPISLESDDGSREEDEKTFRMVPVEFATNLLKFETGSMIPETRFNKAEKSVLDDFVEKKYLKSTKVAGATVYFGLDAKVRRRLINILKRRI